MANPTDLNTRATGALGSDVANLVAEFNKLVVNLRVLTAKMDADAGITDTNYGALVTDSTASGPAKVLTTFG